MLRRPELKEAGMGKDVHLKLTVRLYSDDDHRCFGPGIATLLRRVELHHSLRAAAASMEMAYSKAWRIILHGGECVWLQAAHLHHRRPARRRRGADAGGPAPLDAYEAYVADVDAYSRKKFDEAFGFCRSLQTDEGDAT